MMQIEQSALGTWKVALYPLALGLVGAREGERADVGDLHRASRRSLIVGCSG